jgi:LysM repeat protein
MILVMSKDGQLSDEFKKEIKESGSKKNILGTVTALIAIVLVFGTIGVAGYELLFKPDKVQQKSADEKIESRPDSQTETSTTGTTATAATPTTPKAVTTTTPTTTAQTSNEPQYTEYTVADGDVLGTIATKFNTTVANLKTLNSITDENSLQIGQVIKVPKN